MSNEVVRMSKDDKQRALVPRLRFPEFRDSEGWQTPALAELYGFKRTNTLSRDQLNYETGTVRNIHYGDIHTKFQARFRVSNECVPYVNSEAPDDSFNGKSCCEEGDIVLADASEDLNDVGKAIEIVSLDGQQVVAGTHTILATRHGDEPIVGFGGYLFQSAAVRAGIHKEAQGAKVYGISANRISTIPLLLPTTHAEQQKIAECLGSLDDLIAAEGRKLAALREHKKGLMQQLFPREGETRPRLRFPEFQDAPGWKKRALGELVEVATGQVEPTEPPFCDMPHVSSEHIIPNGGGLRELHSAKELGQTSGKYLFGPTDLLYSKIRPALNKVASPDVEGTCSADIYPIRVIADDLTRTYLFYLLLSDAFLQYAVKNSARSKIPKLNRETLLGFLASIPDQTEQHRIADCLASLDAMIAAQAEKLDALRTHKRGLMQQLFPSPERTAA